MKIEILSLALVRVFASILQAASFILLGRFGGVEELGVAGTIVGLALFGGAVLDLGLSALLPRAHARQEAAAVASGMAITDVVSTVAVVASTVAAAALGLGPFPMLLQAVLLPAALLIDRDVEVRLTIAYAERLRLVPAVSVLLRRLLSILMFLCGVSVGVEPLMSYSASIMIAAIVGEVHVRLALGTLLEGRPGEYRDVLRAAIPFNTSAVLSQVRFLDAPILTAFSGVYAAGVYTAASRFVNPFVLVGSAAGSVLLPRSVALPRVRVMRIARVFVAICLLAALFFGAFGGFVGSLVVFLLGPDFAESAPVLWVLLVGAPFLALNGLLIAMIQGRGGESAIARNSIWFGGLQLAGMLLTAFLVNSALAMAIALGAIWAVRCLTLLLELRRTS